MEKEEEFKGYKFIDERVDTTTRVMAGYHIASGASTQRFYTIREMHALYEAGEDYEVEMKRYLKISIEKYLDDKKTPKN